jgi:hypothetical protein
VAEIRDILAEKNRRSRLKPGGDGGQDGGMPPDLERRVTAIEVKLGSMDAKLDTLVIGARDSRTDLNGLSAKVGEASGKISQLPSTWAMAGWFVTVAIGLAGLVFTIAKAMK